MKKIIFALLLFLVACPAWAATWYAQGTTPNFDAVSGGTTSSVWNAASNGSGAWLDWSTQPATNDVFDANNVTGIVVNTDPKGTAGATKVVLNTPSGGTFVITAAGTYTVTADLGVSGNTGTTDVLAVGSGANAITLTILGNIYGGGTANADGLVVSGSAVTLTVGSVGSPVTVVGGSTTTTYGINCNHSTTSLTIYANITGGSNASAYGIYNGNTGTAAITGNVTGATAPGMLITNSPAWTVTGNCTGSGTAVAGYGCGHTGTGSITVTGNLVYGVAAAPTYGRVRWTPTAPSSGVTGHYFKADGGGTAVYCGKNTNDTSKALTTFYYIDFTDGTSDQGVSTGSGSGGGGAWGF